MRAADAVDLGDQHGRTHQGVAPAQHRHGGDVRVLAQALHLGEKGVVAVRDRADRDAGLLQLDEEIAERRACSK